MTPTVSRPFDGTALVLVDLMPRIIALPVAPHTGDAVHRRRLDLAAACRAAGRPVVAGLVTDMGVESTARSAADLGHDVEFVADAMSGLAADEHDFAVSRVFPRLGTVRLTADYGPLGD